MYVDTPNLFTESGEFMWIEPVELVNSLTSTEHVNSWVFVYWDIRMKKNIFMTQFGFIIQVFLSHNWPKLLLKLPYGSPLKPTETRVR